MEEFLPDSDEDENIKRKEENSDTPQISSKITSLKKESLKEINEARNIEKVHLQNLKFKTSKEQELINPNTSEDEIKLLFVELKISKPEEIQDQINLFNEKIKNSKVEEIRNLCGIKIKKLQRLKDLISKNEREMKK